MGLKGLSGARLGTFALAVIAGTASSMLTPIMPLFLRESLGASVSGVGFALSLASFASMPAPLLLSLLAGRIGISPLLPASFLATTISSALMPSVDSPWIAASLWALFNAGFITIYLASLSILAITGNEEERDRSIGIFLVGMGIGFTSGPALVSGVVAIIGVRLSFYPAALAFLVGLIGSFFGVRGPLRLRGERGPSATRGDIKALFRKGPFLGVLGVIASSSFLMACIFAFTPIHIREVFRLEEARVALLFFGSSLLSTGSTYMVARLVRRFGHWIVVTSSLALSSLSGFAMALAPSDITFYSSFLLAGFTNGFVFPAQAMTIARIVSPSEVPLSNGIILFAYGLGGAVATASLAGVAAGMGIPATIAIASLAPLVGALTTLYTLRASEGPAP